MDAGTATFYGAVIAGVAAILGAFIGGISVYLVAKLAYRTKTEELFLKSLDFLGGGSQKRNLGIAAIEPYLEGERRDLCISLLTGSAIYLLLGTTRRDAAHERYNLKRILELLLDAGEKEGLPKDLHEPLIQAIIDAGKSENSAGVSVDKETLGKWSKRLDEIKPRAL